MGKTYKKFNFNAQFEAKGYPESSWPLLNDYLSRCASEFDLTDKDVEQKLNVLLTNLDSIEIANDVNSNTNACYYPKDKKITLNYDGMSARNETYLAHLCSTFHELNHVCENLSSPNSTSFMQTNPKTGRTKGVSFNEVLTEMKAARLTMNLRQMADEGPVTDPRCMTRHYGYNDLMFVGTMVQTTLGLSEKEFLAAADKGPKYFREVMSKKFPDPAHYDLFMARINFYADSMHAIKYAKTDAPLTKEEMNNITNLTASIYQECLAVMDVRVSTEAAKGDIDPETFSKKTRYELERLTANYEHAIKLNTPYKPEQLKKLPVLGTLQTKIMAIETIHKNSKKLGRKTKAGLLEALNNPKTDPVAFLSNFGLDVPEINEYKTVDTSDYKREFLESDYGMEHWDNKDAIGAIKAMEHDEELMPKKAKILNFKPRTTNAFMTNLTAQVASTDSRDNEVLNTPIVDSLEMDELETKDVGPEL